MSVADKTLDDIMIALADATRRAILEQLFKGEARVTDLAKPFAISLNSVSKHIRILERAGLVTRRKSGRDHFLRFNPQPLEDAAAWIEARRETWRASPGYTGLDAFAELMKAETAAKKAAGWKLPWGKQAGK
jgi:DNA-binding transcriptional ArsR family regulator